MSRLGDIEFTVKSEGKDFKFALSPLKQKQAGRVFHTCVTQLVAAFSGAVGKKGELQMAGIAESVSQVDYDTLYDLAETLCAGAFVNEKPLGSLEDFEPLADTPWILYLIVFHGVKGNWPRVFSGLETNLGGFASTIQDRITSLNTDD